MKKRVIFICRHNAGRSQMAEAFLNARHGDQYSASSAGAEPSAEISPWTVRVMAEAGIDVSEKSPRHLSAFSGELFDLSVLLCDEGQWTVPPPSRRIIRREFPDPSALFSGSDGEILHGFREIRDEISGWIEEYFG